MRKTTKIISLILALCMLISLIPTVAYASSDDELKAEQAKMAFDNALSSNELTWDHLFRAVLAYNKVKNTELGQALAEYYASVESIVLYGQKITDSIYSGTDTGAFTPFTGLIMLDLTDTGITDLGGLAGLVNLEELYISSNPGITDLGALANLSKLKMLDVSACGIDSNDFGALVNKNNLEFLSLSYNKGITSIGPLTTNGAGATTTALSLKMLDISGTGITAIQEVWNAETSSPSLPNLECLWAFKLSLTSISGLVEIVNSQNFDDSNLNWELTGSLISNTDENKSHIARVAAKFDSGNFGAPTVLENDNAALASAFKWKNKFLSKYLSNQDVTWDEIITATYWYKTAKAECTDDASIQILSEIADEYANDVWQLDMSNQNVSRYEISTGALELFPYLNYLNLTNSGIKELGGLADKSELRELILDNNTFNVSELGALEHLNNIWYLSLQNVKGITDFGALENLQYLYTLDLSGTEFDDSDLGAIASLTEIAQLDLSNTKISSIGAITGFDCLEVLDISGTNITVIQEVWDAENNAPAFDFLKTLYANDLELTSISGLVKIVRQEGFDATDMVWDLSGSTYDSQTEEGYVEIIENAFKDKGVFKAPNGKELEPEPEPTPELKPEGEPTPEPKPEPEPEVVIVDTTKVFTDVVKDEWYKEYVDYAYSHKLLVGVSDKEFGTNDALTRGMFVTVLARIAGIDTGADANKAAAEVFTDVKAGEYYSKAVEWAKKNNVVAGYEDGTFRADDKVTREELCKMLVNYVEFAKVTLKDDKEAINFADADKISDWAKSAVTACQKAGIIVGYNEGSKVYFKPQDNAIRAEGSVILAKFHSEYVK